MGNENLADACRSCGSKCCKSGTITLAEREYRSMTDWLVANGTPAELEELRSRTVGHDAHLVYDQKDRCQFLDDRDLCRLHVAGVKPMECWHWPLFVSALDGRLEIRAATCCGAQVAITQDMVDDVERHARSVDLEALTHSPTTLREGSFLIRRVRGNPVRRRSD